jgi:hypothetical protein
MRETFTLATDSTHGMVWLHTSGRRYPVITGGDGEQTEGEPFQIPEDLTTLDDADLAAITERAQAALDVLVENAEAGRAEGQLPSQDDVQTARDLAGAINDLKAERESRDNAAAERDREFQEAVASARPTASDTGDGGDDGGEGTDGGDGEGAGEGGGDTGDDGAGEDGGAGQEASEGELVNAAAGRSRGPLRVAVTPRRPTLNPSLRDIGRNAPDPGVEDRRPNVVITAAADVPHFANGETIATLEDLAKAATAKANSLGVGNGNPHFVPLAKIKRAFPTVFDADQMTPQQVRGAWDDMVEPWLKAAGGMEALVAAGGWCAPSEIRYEFFNITDVAGMVDLPTFGVNRGGLKWPQSLSLFDIFAAAGGAASGLATNATMPWEWTETDDIAASTGSPQKACLRPACPSFDEARLRVFGLCVTAGNLTEDAFPELIQDFIAKVVVAHARVINRRLLLQMAAASTATTPTVSGETAVTAAMGGLELNAIDYREKHGMAPEAVLEVVLPSWIRGVWRSDLAKRNGEANLEVADAQLMDMLDVRRLRGQFVQDWQTRLATGIAPVGGGIPTNWPTTVQAMMYAPATFGRGNGMTLDLGVVRDSVLNRSNDHTAAWSEEATMLAKFGHESRLITLNSVAGGATGAQAAHTGA